MSCLFACSLMSLFSTLSITSLPSHSRDRRRAQSEEQGRDVGADLSVLIRLHCHFISRCLQLHFDRSPHTLTIFTRGFTHKRTHVLSHFTLITQSNHLSSCAALSFACSVTWRRWRFFTRSMTLFALVTSLWSLSSYLLHFTSNY
jgi:hypothetical protein